MKKLFVIFAFAALATFSASAQKLAKVNFTELVQLMPEADAAREQINAMSNEAQETYSSMVEEYQTKANAYQQKNTSWTAAIRESKERELYDIQNRIQEFQQTISQELQQQQGVLMAPIYEKAQETVRNLAKELGITAVFDASAALYFDEDSVLDLTQDARKALGIPADRTLESLQAELQAQAQSQQLQ